MGAMAQREPSADPIRVCLFGTYDRQAHPRIAVLEAALRDRGARVVEAHVPAWPGGTEDKLAMARSPLSPRRMLRLAGTWARLARRYRRAGPHDVVLVGYFGHLDVLLARLLAGRRRVVLDMFLSVYDTVVLDRQLVRPGTPAARLARRLDRLAVRCADLALLDTPQQVDFAVETLGLPRGKLAAVPVGAEPAHFAPGPPPADGPLRILFYGTFIPLHGTRTIARAIRQVHREDITFTIVGRGQERAAFDRELAGIEGVAVHDWLPYDRIGELVAGHDVVLGIFGGTGKAGRVVPGKVYQAACAGRAVVTADTPATRAAFGPDEVVLVPPDDPDALAVSLRELAKDRPRVAELGRRARARYQRDYAPAAIGRRLERLLAAPAEPPRWVPAPRFLLRLDAVRRLLPRLARDQAVLEVGFGAGAMLEELQAQGFTRVLGIDFSATAARLAGERLAALPADHRPRLALATLDALHPARARFGAILAFEVLEHVADDRGFLADAYARLVPGGHMLVSVPAHQDRFSAWDEMVGHVRRYEREELRARFEEAGFRVEALWSYGYPLANLLERVRRGVAAPGPGGAEGLHLRTAESGNRVPARGLVRLLVRPATMAPFLVAQRPFFGGDRGDGYLLLARKPAAT
jgi:glycosyltransferase involved in cell wall biosynthesis